MYRVVSNNREPLRAPKLCVWYSIAIREFKYELPFGKAQIRDKSLVFHPVWPWNLADDVEKQ